METVIPNLSSPANGVRSVSSKNEAGRLREITRELGLDRYTGLLARRDNRRHRRGRAIGHHREQLGFEQPIRGREQQAGAIVLRRLFGSRRAGFVRDGL